MLLPMPEVVVVFCTVAFPVAQVVVSAPAAEAAGVADVATDYLCFF